MPVDISEKLYYAASCTFSDTIKVENGQMSGVTSNLEIKCLLVLKGYFSIVLENNVLPKLYR